MAARMMQRKFPVLVILGPTGSGKSKLAVELAQLFQGEIISTDSMQVYKGLDIVTNKVTEAEMSLCKHHLINYVEPLKFDYRVTEFRDSALEIISNLHEANKLAVLVGGTNYYIEALLWNLLIDVSTDSQADSSTQLTPETTTLHSDRNSRSITKADSAKDDSTKDDSTRADSTKDNSFKADNTKDDSTKDYSSSDGSSSDGSSSDSSSACKLQDHTPQQLHEMLMQVDPAQARILHPCDQRKVRRALEVYQTTGRRLSDLLAAQHREAASEAGGGGGGGGGVSGPLRYPHACVLWLQCQQQVLDTRLDARVDDMIGRGLLQELHHFHQQYNQHRLQQHHSTGDYTEGIFQSIGFKEFHEYLILPQGLRTSPHGQTLLEKGIADMKLATRRYARKQNKWVRNRFLKRRGSAAPPVYALDATDVTQWEKNVLRPAARIVQQCLQGQKPDIEPLPTQDNPVKREQHVCEICDRVFTTNQQWADHLAGRKHRLMIQHKRKLENKQQAEAEHENRHETPNQQQQQTS